MEVYTVAIGNLPITPRKKVKKALKWIETLEGFIAFMPCYPHGTLCLFKEENQAIRAKNLMDAYPIQTGKNVSKITIPFDEYIKAITRKGSK